MARKQVFKLAKELGLSSRDMLHDLKEIGIEVKNNFSVLEEKECELVREHIEEKTRSASPPVEPPQAPQPAEAAPATATAEREPAQTDGKPQGTTAVVEAPTEEKVEAPPKPKIPEKPTGDPRPPVVAVLGHVDHGKTTLLDKIRQSHVAEQETGGITQSIGAYQVESEGQKITFIDTPGHRAFTGMRARGAQVTDLVILVIAADDGVMEQTREAIAHAKAANVPILVAINKIDKPGADVSRVKQQLTEEGVTPEDWGGETITMPVSAITGEGIEELLEMILLVAELEEIRADAKRPAQGTIIESHLDTARGPVATAIIKDGTLRERDVVSAGTAYGRIRALFDDQGKRLQEALPGTPVQILGLSEVPPVGAQLEVADSPSKTKKIVEGRKAEERRAKMERARLTWEDVLAQTAGQGTLKLILKADTLGSLEAVQNELRRLETEELNLEFIHTGVGHISESDLLLAASSEAEIGVIGFRVDIDSKAKELADREQVSSVRTYEIIYELADDVRKALRELLEPEYEEVSLGVVEVRQVFRIPRVGAIAGCYVRDGKVTRNAYVRVVRNDSEVYQEKIHSLKRFDQDVREVTKDKECGIKIEGFDEVQVGDRLEIFTLREIERV